MHGASLIRSPPRMSHPSRLLQMDSRRVSCYFAGAKSSMNLECGTLPKLGESLDNPGRSGKV